MQSLDSGERTVLFAGMSAKYVSTGHIVYVEDNVLFAVPFDLATLQVVGGTVSASRRYSGDTTVSALRRFRLGVAGLRSGGLGTVASAFLPL